MCGRRSRGSCPLSGYKVTQSRSHIIALPVRAGHGALSACHSRAGTAAAPGLCPVANLPFRGSQAGAVSVPIPPPPLGTGLYLVMSFL